jgi:tRNA U38,U39,U40 pseudouridine synthase TruA
VCDFEGNGFLYKMVRLLVGAAVRCAQGKLEPTEIKEFLKPKGELLTEANPRVVARRAVADAEGLYLVNVKYPS